jgi:hypothetical protein
VAKEEDVKSNVEMTEGKNETSDISVLLLLDPDM